jgi:FkbM family methyltransferase
MILTSIKKILKSFLRYLGWKLVKIKIKTPTTYPHPDPDIQNIECIIKATGILHIGGHRGTEAGVYNWFKKKVLWIEAIPEFFLELNDSVNRFYNQKAICALLGDKNKEKQDFFIANNDAATSSLFDFSKDVKKKNLWSDRNFKMVKKLSLDMITLDYLLEDLNISAIDYNHWILDVQGAELLVLKGAKKSLINCNSIQVEVSRVEFYEGGVLWNDLLIFLKEYSFFPTSYPQVDHTEILFLKKNI